MEFDDIEQYCNWCGKPGDLDMMGCCSAECDNAMDDDFISKGHNHGCCDPPEDCPICGD